MSTLPTLLRSMALLYLYLYLYIYLHSTPPLILIVLSRLDRGILSATEMLPLKRGRIVAHVFNFTPAFVDMRLADALVFVFGLQ